MSQNVGPLSAQQLAPELNLPPAAVPAPPAAPPPVPPADQLEASFDCCGCCALLREWGSFFLELCCDALEAIYSFFSGLYLCCVNPRAYRAQQRAELERRQIRGFIDWLDGGPGLEVRPQQEILTRLLALPAPVIRAARQAVEERHRDEIENIKRGLGNQERKAVPRRGDERPQGPVRLSPERLQSEAVTIFLRENPSHPTVIQALQFLIERTERERRQIPDFIAWLNTGPGLEVRPQQEILTRLLALPAPAIRAIRRAIAERHHNEIENIKRDLRNQERKDERPQGAVRLSPEQLQSEAVTIFLRENPSHPTVVQALQNLID